MRPLLLFCVALGIVISRFAFADDAARRPLYYQDPDGKPAYSAGPRKTPDNRDYTPIFDDSPATQSPAAAAPASQPAKPSDHRVLYYRNPMGLADTSPVPKKDSMGMDYIPVYADEGTQDDTPGTVRVSPGRLQTLGVRTEAVTLRPAEARAVQATGSLQFDERGLATVTTKVSGWIDHLNVSATGDTVQRGQVLAEIYAPDLVASEEEFLVASRMGGAIADASDQRLRALDIPPEEITRLRKTGQASRTIAVLAPANGVVIDKPAQQGMRVNAGDPLYKTADLSDIWLIAQVQEQDLGAIVPGARATATFVAFPGRTFEGRVDFIYPSLSPETRTARVRIVFPNADGSLREQMYATVAINTMESQQPTLMVPYSAVLDSGTKQFVLVARGEGRFEPHAVRLGIRSDDFVEVRDGLKIGDRVVTSANFLIDAESNLRAALQGFSSGDKPESSQTGTKP